jgi:hypothetical protein
MRQGQELSDTAYYDIALAAATGKKGFHQFGWSEIFFRSRFSTPLHLKSFNSFFGETLSQMDSGSLLQQVRQVQRTALDEQNRHAQHCIQRELEEAGPNPVVTDKKVLDECLVYLETRVLEYAALGRSDVVVFYSDVPAMQLRMQAMQKLRFIQEMDRTAMVKAVADAFTNGRGAGFFFNAQYMGNAFKIGWN